MSFTSWLKSIGTAIAGGTKRVEAVAPLATALVEAVAPQTAPALDTFNAILGTVVSVEGTVASIANSNISGSDKAKAAGSLVAQVIMAAPFMQGKKINDQVKFQNACGTIAGGVADLLNSLQG